MLLAGDELGRTQSGNNNAYCQDNETSWYPWDLQPGEQNFLEFVQYLIELRHDQPALRRRKFFQGRPIRGTDVKDIYWFEPSGREMDDSAWNNPTARCLGLLLAGRSMDECDEQGNLLVGDTLFMMLNVNDEAVIFTLPELEPESRWERLLDTAESQWGRRSFRDHRYKLRRRSLALLRLRPSRE
ncbi:MAG: hypothetical protein GY953_06090 [bacterium]|nr:hypothetical protein [bacterium]